MRRPLATTAALGLLLLAAGCNEDADSVPASPPVPTVSGQADGDCRFASFAGGGARWRMQARDFQMRRYLESVLTQRYGRVTKVDPGPRLQHGLIGFTSDVATHELVAVVDPALIDVAQLDAALKQAARKKLPELKAGPEIKVRAQAGCHSAAEMREAYDVLREAKDRRPRTYLSSIRFAPESSAFHVYAVPGSPVAQELRDRLGDRVIVEEVVIKVG